MSGYIGNKPLSKVTGVFTPNQQYDLVRSNNWGNADPNWNDVVLLLQPVTGATSIEDLSKSNHSVTNNGVTLDSSNEKWTGAPSMLFEASNSDYLQLSDSSDWDLLNYDFTIEMFAYFASLSNNARQPFVTHYQDSSNQYCFQINNDSGNGLTFFEEDGGSITDIVVEGSNRTSPVGSWVHLALTRSGNTFHIFVDGTLTASVTSTISIGDFSGALEVGRRAETTSYFDGNMTSLRITKGVARYTSAFIPPTRPFPTR
jgi:hypothetical protein